MNASIAAHIITALLSIYPNTPARSRIEAGLDRIAVQVSDASLQHGVPAELLISVGFHETHLGTDAGEGGGWGAPIDARHRHIAGTASTAARILARSREVCGDWRRAVTRFRSGLCTLSSTDRRKHYVESVMRLAHRLGSANVLPDSL